MSFLNSMIKAAASSLLGDNPELLNKAAALLTELLSKTGGLPGLIQKFQEHDLGNIINSWMSSDENLPISTEQLDQVFGVNFISHLAEQAELDDSVFSMLLTKALPQLVSHLTQNGQIAPQNAPELSLDTVQNLLKQLLS